MNFVPKTVCAITGFLICVVNTTLPAAGHSLVTSEGKLVVVYEGPAQFSSEAARDAAVLNVLLPLVQSPELRSLPKARPGWSFMRELAISWEQIERNRVDGERLSRELNDAYPHFVTPKRPGLPGQLRARFKFVSETPFVLTAAEDGVVRYADYFLSYGKTLVIKYASGLTVSYPSLGDFAVGPGDVVRAGLPLGTFHRTRFRDSLYVYIAD